MKTVKTATAIMLAGLLIGLPFGQAEAKCSDRRAPGMDWSGCKKINKLLGDSDYSGSRFDGITRGMLDVRDLYFYASVGAAFLALNVYGLERSRWADDGDGERHQAWRLGTGFLVLNLLLANVWLSQVTSLRFDLTEDKLVASARALQAKMFNQLKCFFPVSRTHLGQGRVGQPAETAVVGPRMERPWGCPRGNILRRTEDGLDAKVGEIHLR